MNILFRADSSFEIGTGHIMRDLVLAKKFEKDRNTIFFATRDLEGNINSKIIEENYHLTILNTNDYKELVFLIDKLEIDLLVIDHYDIDYKYETQIKEDTKVKILSFDDTYEKHYCDILLNHNISAEEKKYKGLVPSKCELWCGFKYTLIRDEFYMESKKKYSNKKIILVALGGSDTFEMNITVLKVLKCYKSYEINIVTTTANQNIDKLKKYISLHKNMRLHINSTQIAKLINISSFVIVTPSVILNEVVFMKKPFIAIEVVENQRCVSDFFIKKGFFIIRKNKINSLNLYIKKIVSSMYINKIKRKLKNI